MLEFTEHVARLKAWQVFAALVLPIVLSQFILMSSLPPVSTQPQSITPEDFEAVFRRTMIFSLIMVVLLLTWLLSIGFAANRRLAPDLRLETRLVLWAAAYAAGYIGLTPYIWPSPSDFAVEHGGMGLILPLHLLSMAALFYVLAFAARTITMAERQSPVKFFDYSGPFFLLWFFPIGVWFVQPRVNQLISSRPSPG